MPKISKVTLLRENLELTRPYTIAYKTTSAVENCFVLLESESGKIGIGAANPSKLVVGESVEDCWNALQEIEGSLVGKEIAALSASTKWAGSKFPNQPGANAAVDIALYDLFCKEMGISVAEYFGQVHQELPTSITIGIKNIEETIEEAQEYYDRGFRYLKVKLGNELTEDLERIAKLREVFGRKIFIRIDANQGYSSEELLHFAESTRHHQIELVEQPLPADKDDIVRGLPPFVVRKVAADESLIKLDHAIKLLEPSNACGIFNIKLMKCGGLTEASRIADFANRRSIDLMWGCNDESIVSISAALHLALSCENTKFLDLDGSLDLARDLVKGGFVIEDGMMKLTEGAGLGVDLL